VLQKSLNKKSKYQEKKKRNKKKEGIVQKRQCQLWQIDILASSLIIMGTFRLPMFREEELDTEIKKCQKEICRKW